ncbi:MAG: hypothetical protein KGQ41_01880 [Alphaproteobacteria bacterium]|nr:hypothetical protein [Alphaproteobacteria bacterium]
MTAQRIGGIETSHELPVESLLNQSIEGFMEVHKELSKLPQDPSDPLLPAEAMLRDMGVDVDNDFSMFIMGAMGQVGMDMGMQAMGMATNATAAASLDIASGILMGMSENSKDKNKRKEASSTLGATSMYRTSRFKKADELQKKPAQPTTSFMRDAMKRKRHLQLKASQTKRNALKRQMNTHMENIRELIVFKSCGVKYAHRVSVPNGQTGETETYLVAAKDKPHQALKSNGKSYEKPIDVSMCVKPDAAPRMAMGF